MGQFWLLTQRSHLFGKICSKPAKKVTTGQQVEWGVAPHGIKGERVHGAREARHVTYLVLSVGCHREKVQLVVQMTRL